MHIERLGKGPPLVLLHGWGLHGGIYAPLLPALAARHAVHVVDLPGHGRSAPPAGALDLGGVARELLRRLPGAIWIGWSLGGLVALEAAIEAPHAVRAVAAIATSPRFVPGPDWPHGVAHAVFDEFGANLARDWRGTVERFLALECLGSEGCRAELRALRAHVLDHGMPAVSALADGLRILADTDLRAELAALALPVLWIGGARDRLVPAAAVEAAAALTPGSRCVIIPGGGHAPFVGRPAAVLDALLAWIAGLPRA